MKPHWIRGGLLAPSSTRKGVSGRRLCLFQPWTTVWAPQTLVWPTDWSWQGLQPLARVLWGSPPCNQTGSAAV